VPLVEALRSAAAFVYVEELDAPVVSLPDAHHLSRSLRLRPGDAVTACNGRGSFRACRVARIALGLSDRRRGAPTEVTLEPDGPVRVTGQPEVQIGVGFALVKQDRSDWAVAKLTELGVDRIMPMICERSVVRPEGPRRAERLARIAREAAMQSRRLFLPVVEAPRRVGDIVAELALGGGTALAEPGGGRLSLVTPFVLVGPEGGWSPAELALRLPLVGLGDTILRTETAALAAAARLVALRSNDSG
jgi:16S rRNA (uracil1498-N3)-methyltransferase